MCVKHRTAPQKQNYEKRTNQKLFILVLVIFILSVFCIKLAIHFGEIVRTLDFLSQRLNLIGEHVDAIRQGIQSIP